VDLCAEVVSVVMSDESNRPLISAHASLQQPTATAQPSADQVTSLLSSLAEGAKKGGFPPGLNNLMYKTCIDA
jgi:hypothetical protein